MWEEEKKMCTTNNMQAIETGRRTNGHSGFFPIFEWFDSTVKTNLTFFFWRFFFLFLSIFRTFLFCLRGNWDRNWFSKKFDCIVQFNSFWIFFSSSFMYLTALKLHSMFLIFFSPLRRTRRKKIMIEFLLRINGFYLQFYWLFIVHLHTQNNECNNLHKKWPIYRLQLNRVSTFLQTKLNVTREFVIVDETAMWYQYQ